MFAKYQYKILNKNLNFCPTPERYKKNEVINNFKKFERKIKLKAHFALQENHDINQLNYEKYIIPKKRTWKTNKNDHTVNTFVKAIDNDIENLLTKKTTLPKSNLSIREKEALEQLGNRNDLIFIRTDKD